MHTHVLDGFHLACLGHSFLANSQVYAATQPNLRCCVPLPLLLLLVVLLLCCCSPVLLSPLRAVEPSVAVLSECVACVDRAVFMLFFCVNSCLLL